MLRASRLLLSLALAACRAASPPATVVDTDRPTAETSDTGAPDCGARPLLVTGGFSANGYPFEPAAPGAVLQILRGAGWTARSAFRVEGTNAAVGFSTRVTRIDTGQVISGVEGSSGPNGGFVFLDQDGVCSGLAWVMMFFDDVAAGPLALETPADFCDLAGAEVEVAWDVVDLEDGRAATGTVRAVLALDPLDVLACAGT